MTWIFSSSRPNSLWKPIRRAGEVRRDWFYLYWLLAKKSRPTGYWLGQVKKKNISQQIARYTSQLYSSRVELSSEPTLFQYQIFKRSFFYGQQLLMVPCPKLIAASLALASSRIAELFSTLSASTRGVMQV